jgi:hypothetical protein
MRKATKQASGGASSGGDGLLMPRSSCQARDEKHVSLAEGRVLDPDRAWKRDLLG